jgi:transcriptional regulator with XRE-family HTH domain
MSKLRTFLKKERGERKWSLTDLAEKSGIPMSTLSRWESPRDTSRPDHDNILGLARAFDMEASDVLRYIGYPRPKFASDSERDQEWAKLRDMIESDPRAKQLLELYRDASEEDKDRGLELLRVGLKKTPPDKPPTRPRRRPRPE